MATISLAQARCWERWHTCHQGVGHTHGLVLVRSSFVRNGYGQDAIRRLRFGRDLRLYSPPRAEISVASQPAGIAGLETVICKALEKDRNLRYQSAAEMRADLQRLKRGTESSPVGSVLASSRMDRRLWLAISGLVVLAIAIGILAFRRLTPKTFPFQKFQITQLTSTGSEKIAAISPDGKYVAFNETEGGGAFYPIPHEKQGLRIMQVAGGEVQIVPPAEVDYRGLTSSHDGNICILCRRKPKTDTALVRSTRFRHWEVRLNG